MFFVFSLVTIWLTSRASKLFFPYDVAILGNLQRLSNCILAPTQQTTNSAVYSCAGNEGGKKGGIFLLMQKEKEDVCLFLL